MTKEIAKNKFAIKKDTLPFSMGKKLLPYSGARIMEIIVSDTQI